MTRQDLKAAQDKLVMDGWTQAFSVMHDGGASGDYGIAFVKGETTFYLNKDSYTHLPIVRTLRIPASELLTEGR